MTNDDIIVNKHLSAPRQLLPRRRTLAVLSGTRRLTPSSLKEIVFLTLEDETGFVNVVLWPQVCRRYVVLAKTARLLGVTGRLQVQAGVVHLIAQRMWIPQLPLMITTGTSRDFH